MNVASLELCRELYELGWWEGTDHAWAYHTNERHLVHLEAGYGVGENWDYAPAYDLGYLLRKLPREVHANQLQLTWNSNTGYEQWECGYIYIRDYEFDPMCWDDTPEDAVAKLAIELFKQGVLTREGGV